MSEVPFYALAQWDAIGRVMYAHDPGYVKGEKIYLSHRPREAAKFETPAAAEAVRKEWESKVDWARYDESATPRALMLEVMLVTERTLQSVYSDGSGLASEHLRNAMDQLHRYEEHCRTLRAFVQKYLDRLNGLSWSCGCWYSEPRLELGGRACHGRYVEPDIVAAFWPEVKWKREKEKYPNSGRLEYSWVGNLDGVQIRIDRAESIRLDPVDDGRDGTVVRLPRRKAVAT